MKRRVLYFCDHGRDWGWLDHFQPRLPGVEFVREEDLGSDTSDIEVAIVWNPPLSVLQKVPTLKLVHSLGAGVDAIVRLMDGLPDQVQVARLVDPVMAQRMSLYGIATVVHYHRGLDRFDAQQGRQEWKPAFRLDAADYRVGVMGMGYLGTHVAQALGGVGYHVSGWSRSGRGVERVQMFAGEDGLGPFLSELHCLICLLPLTPGTRGILNGELFGRLPKDAVLINVARGEHLVEEDLLASLDSGHLAGATLDVFRHEPLPKGHPFWSHPKVRVTPHISSLSNVPTAVEQIAQNLERFWAGETVQNTVDRVHGY